jgi:hypothetical protein
MMDVALYWHTKQIYFVHSSIILIEVVAKPHVCTQNNFLDVPVIFIHERRVISDQGKRTEQEQDPIEYLSIASVPSLVMPRTTSQQCQSRCRSRLAALRSCASCYRVRQCLCSKLKISTHRNALAPSENDLTFSPNWLDVPSMQTINFFETGPGRHLHAFGVASVRARPFMRISRRFVESEKLREDLIEPHSPWIYKDVLECAIRSGS